MSDFQEILLAPQGLISIPQYQQMMYDHFYDNDDDWKSYNASIADY